MQKQTHLPSINEKLKASKTFCAKPFEHIYVSNSGRQLACCISRQTENNTYDYKSVESLWNSEYLKEVRKMMLNGEQHKTCSVCYDLEKQNIPSRRQPKLNYGTIDDLTLAEDGNLELNIKSLDLRLGNLCNLACRMCSPTSSSLLIKEWLEAPFKEMQNRARFSKSITNTKNLDLTKKIVQDGGARIQDIYLAGGEPLVILEQEELLEQIIQNTNPNSIDLELNSNLTKIPPNFIKKIDHFKSTKINVSIDGYGPLNEFIRFPSKWTVVSSNLKSLLDIKKFNGKLSINVSITVQIYNVLYLEQLIRFLSSVGLNDTEINFSLLEEPDLFSIKHLPSKLSDLAKSRLLMLEETYPHNSEFSEKIIAIRKNLGGERKNSEIHFNNFKLFTNYLDQSRKQNFLEICPEFVDSLS